MQDKVLENKEIIVNKDDLIIQMLQDIKNAQASQLALINSLNAEHTILKGDVITMKNGYEPYEITQMLHWVDKKMKDDESVHVDIKKSLINWIVPALLTLMVAGAFILGPFN